jgi:hypothetical protein
MYHKIYTRQTSHVQNIAFCIHDVRVPLTGGVSKKGPEKVVAEKYTPLPPTLKFYSPGVQNTVYGPGTPSGANWGGGGLSGARRFSFGGIAGERFFIFYYVVGEEGEIFFNCLGLD